MNNINLVQKRIEEKALKRFWDTYNDFLDKAYSNDFGKSLKINTIDNQDESRHLFNASGTSGGTLFNKVYDYKQEPNNFERIKQITNFEKIKEELVNQYIKEETDKLLKNISTLNEFLNQSTIYEN